jgi:hypothetical protein
MADIDVVPRHKSRAWLWWVLAIVAIAIVAMLMMGGDGTGDVGRVLVDSPLVAQALEPSTAISIG